LTTFEAAQDLHGQPLALGRVVRAVHMSCGVPATCSAHQPQSAADGCRRIDDTRGLVAFGDPHVPPSVTLQDVAMILGLPIDGTPICGMVSSAGLRDSVG
jgi:hypothetical protein